jgi:hypothetical protein
MRRAVVYLLWRELRWRIAIVAVVLILFVAEAVYARNWWGSLSDLRLWLIADSNAPGDWLSWLPSVGSPLPWETRQAQRDLLLPLIPFWHGLPLLVVSFLLGIHPYGHRGSAGEFLATKPALGTLLPPYRFRFGSMLIFILYLFPTVLFWTLFPRNRLIAVAENATGYGERLAYDLLLNFPVAMGIIAFWGFLAYFWAFYLFRNLDELGPALTLSCLPPLVGLIADMSYLGLSDYPMIQTWNKPVLVRYLSNLLEYFIDYWWLGMAFLWVAALLIIGDRILSRFVGFKIRGE